MPTIVACHGCGTKLKLKGGLSGKRIRCPACRAVISVGAGLLSDPPESGAPADAVCDDDGDGWALDASLGDLPYKRRSWFRRTFGPYGSARKLPWKGIGVLLVVVVVLLAGAVAVKLGLGAYRQWASARAARVAAVEKARSTVRVLRYTTTDYLGRGSALSRYSAKKGYTFLSVEVSVPAAALRWVLYRTKPDPDKPQPLPTTVPDNIYVPYIDAEMFTLWFPDGRPMRGGLACGGVKDELLSSWGEKSPYMQFMDDENRWISDLGRLSSLGPLVGRVAFPIPADPAPPTDLSGYRLQFLGQDPVPIGPAKEVTDGTQK
jgi:LSD1 subclass zinc finger protein